MPVQNKAGIRPEYVIPTYKITTVQAQEFIQKRLNAAVKVEREKAVTEGKDATHITNVNCTLVTATPSKKFRLFLILLPIEATTRERDNNELSLFNPNGDSSRTKRLRPEIMAILQPYMFSKFDKQKLINGEGLKDLQISRTIAQNLAGAMSPKINPMGAIKGSRGKKIVGFFIDPVRIFNDMLSPEGERPDINNLTIRINGSKRLSNANFEYIVTTDEREKSTNGNFEEELIRGVDQALRTRPYRRDDD